MEAETKEVKEHHIKEQIPWSETCFGCNGGANQGIGMRSYITEDGYVVGVCHTKSGHQGYPDTVHGGLVATYFDEVLWHATRLADPDLIAMTVEMNTRYFKPVPVDTDVRIVGEPAVIDGRHIHVDGYLLLPDNTVAATASIHYITVRKEHTLNQTEPARIKHSVSGLDLGNIYF
jgi:acyl-coenzyme A thioesterase PaaI-like protein